MFLKYLIAIFIVMFSFISFADHHEPVEEEAMSAEELLSVQPEDIVIGNEDAPVTIIEYASMSCSHCADFHNDTFHALKEKYIDNGKVKFIFRNFPLDEPALRGAMLANCAARESKEDYLKFLKVMFSTQSNWAPKKNYLEILANIAKLGGMTGNEFELCIADSDLEHSIMKGKFYASKYLEVRSTPTLFINKQMHKGSRSIDYLSKTIDSLFSVDEEEGKK